MVRTGTRLRILKELLTGIGLRSTAAAAPVPRLEALSAEHADAVMDFYRALGGRSPAARFRPGPWDLVFDDGLVVELDEELHFNRYRALSLEAGWCATLPWRDDYLTFCREQEAACVAAGRWGQRWTTASSEAMFGTTNPAGILRSRGAPRWKQRALYDVIKDAFAVTDASIRLTRLATHDCIDGVQLGVALRGRAALDLGALAALVKRRTIVLL